ncbi:hypothetical protein [Sinorhizobium saheli]|jgi:hypothetical protein|nr:hypothetical protein [Sinorhizobium saheli]
MQQFKVLQYPLRLKQARGAADPDYRIPVIEQTDRNEPCRF